MGIMRDVRRAVEVLVDSVTAVCAHNAELVGLGVLFNHIAKAAEKDTGLDGGDRLVKGLTGSLNQAHHIRVGLGLITNVVCLIEIRVQAIAVDGNVEVDDITVLKRALVRDTVANDLVNAGADTLGEVVVVEWRRVGVALHALLVDDGVNLLGGHTGLDSGSASVKHLTRVPVKLAELDNGLGVHDLNVGAAHDSALGLGDTVNGVVGQLDALLDRAAGSEGVDGAQITGVSLRGEGVVGVDASLGMN